MRSKNSVALLLSTLLLGSSAAMAADELSVQHQNGIAYVAGGVGNDAQQKIQSMGEDFSLKLTFAIPAGNYLGGGEVEIADSNGNKVLEVTTEGPIFYADLEPGTYTITAQPAMADAKPAVRRADIGDEQTVVHFAWDI